MIEYSFPSASVPLWCNMIALLVRIVDVKGLRAFEAQQAIE